MTHPRVFIISPADSAKADESYRIMEEAGCELVYGKKSWRVPQDSNEDEMWAMAKGADVIAGRSIRNSPITGRIMQNAPDLRVVAKYVIGVDDVDVKAATEQGILVTHCPAEAILGGTAEGTMGIMLTLLKKTREKDQAVKHGGWKDPSLEGRYVGRRQDGYPGLTIGIVGLGRIARVVVELLAPWKARIIAYDPYVDNKQFAARNVEKVDLPTLLKESDVVSLHVVLTDETSHMIGAEEIAMMKQDAILINTSRGQVIDEKAMAEALESGKLAAAGLDAFEHEPLPADSPLRKLGNKVLLSPHMINDGSGLGPGIEWTTRSVLAVLNGEVPDNVYNKEIIPRWLERFGGHKVEGFKSNR